MGRVPKEVTVSGKQWRSSAGGHPSPDLYDAQLSCGEQKTSRV